MPLWTPDLFVEVALLTPEAGGRRVATPPNWYGCPIEIDGLYFDGRLDLTEVGPVEPGRVFEAPLKFSWPEGARPHFDVGKCFSLWEGRTVGAGKVLAVYDHV